MSGFVVVHLVCILLFVGFRLPEVRSSAETPRHDRRPGVRPDVSTTAEAVTLSPDEIRQRQDRERSKQRYLLQTLKNVLQSTALMTRPNVTGNGLSRSDVEAIKQRMEETMDEEEKQNHHLANRGRIRRVQTILPSCELVGRHGNRSRLQKNELRLFFFNVVPQELSQKNDRIKVISANLAIKRKPLSKPPNGKRVNRKQNRKRKSGNSSSGGHLDNWKVRIRIYRQQKVKRVLKTVPLGAWNSTEWMKIGIMKAVEDWYKAPNHNTGLEVTVLDRKNRPVSPFQVFEDYNCARSKSRRKGEQADTEPRGTVVVNDQKSNVANFPHLEIVTTVRQRTPERRQRHLKPCKMTSTYIKFDDYEPKWRDKVLAPLGFATGICTGACTDTECRPSHSKTANSTRNLLQNETSGCCRPTRTSSLPVLLLDDDETIRLSTIENLIVEKCGCPL